MAAFGDVVVEELRNVPASLSYKANAVYTRVIKFTIAALATVATGDLTGFKLPPGTLVLGGAVKLSAALEASQTLAFKTETASVTFVAAKAFGVAESIIPADSAALAVPGSATADDQVQCVMGGATAGAAAVDVTLTLVLVGVGEPDSLVESNDT